MMLGKMIRERRTQLGMTQKQLAQKIGVDGSAVSLWESGDRIPSEEAAESLASALNMEHHEIIPALRLNMIAGWADHSSTPLLQEAVVEYMEQVWPDAKPAAIVLAINDALQEYVAGSSWPEDAPDEDILERTRSRRVQIGSIILLALALAESEGESGYKLAVDQLNFRHQEIINGPF